MSQKCIKFIIAPLCLVFFTFLLLLAGEFFLRFYYKDVLSVASGPSFFAERARALFSSERNNFSLRGDYIKYRHDGRYRIIVQGDSFTYGQGLYPREKRYTEILEKNLRNKNFINGVVVINAGVLGLNLPEHIKYASVVSSLSPDFVLYQWFLNDMKTELETRLTPHFIKNRNAHAFLIKKSVLYGLIQMRYGQIRTAMGKQKSFDQDMLDRFQNPQSAESLTADRLLNELFDKYKAKGIDFGVVLFPSFFQDMATYQLGFLHDRVLACCQQHQIRCLDLRDLYKSVPHSTLWVNQFDAHPGELANKMAAQAIYDYYGEYWQEQAGLHAAKAPRTERKTER